MFKLRYPHHQRSFKFLKYKTDTELPCEVWQMEKSGQTPVTTWKIVRQCSPYNPNSKRYNLCLNEKMEIATYRGSNLMNKKTELISKCRHQNKYTLSKYDTEDWRQLYYENHYIGTFHLLIIFSWRLLGSHQHEILSTEPKLSCISSNDYSNIYIYI